MPAGELGVSAAHDAQHRAAVDTAQAERALGLVPPASRSFRGVGAAVDDAGTARSSRSSSAASVATRFCAPRVASGLTRRAAPAAPAALTAPTVPDPAVAVRRASMAAAATAAARRTARRTAGTAVLQEVLRRTALFPAATPAPAAAAAAIAAAAPAAPAAPDAPAPAPAVAAAAAALAAVPPAAAKSLPPTGHSTDDAATLARRAAAMARAAAQLVWHRQDALRFLLLRPAFVTLASYIPLHRARLAACHFACRCCAVMLRRWRRWGGRRRRDQRAAALAAARCARVRRSRALAHWQDVVLLPLLTQRALAESNAQRQARSGIATWRAHRRATHTAAAVAAIAQRRLALGLLRCAWRAWDLRACRGCAAAAAAAARRQLAMGLLRGAWGAWGLRACRGRAAAARRLQRARRRLRVAWRAWATRRLDAQCLLAAQGFACHAFARCRATAALLLWRCAVSAGRTAYQPDQPAAAAAIRASRPLSTHAGTQESVPAHPCPPPTPLTPPYPLSQHGRPRRRRRENPPPPLAPSPRRCSAAPRMAPTATPRAPCHSVGVGGARACAPRPADLGRGGMPPPPHGGGGAMVRRRSRRRYRRRHRHRPATATTTACYTAKHNKTPAASLARAAGVAAHRASAFFRRRRGELLARRGRHAALAPARRKGRWHAAAAATAAKPRYAPNGARHGVRVPRRAGALDRACLWWHRCGWLARRGGRGRKRWRYRRRRRSRRGTAAAATATRSPAAASATARRRHTRRVVVFWRVRAATMRCCAAALAGGDGCAARG